MFIVIGAIVIILILIGAALISTYNSLITLRNKVRNQFAQIDAILQQRADMIPNLVETVKGYATHERETLQAVINARAKAVNASTMQEKADADNEISQALSRLMAVTESYPDLKANLAFQQLQSELSETEDKVRYARQFYNDTVNKYNTSLEVFPRNLIGGMLGFRTEEYFQTDASAKSAPKVSF